MKKIINMLMSSLMFFYATSSLAATPQRGEIGYLVVNEIIKNHAIKSLKASTLKSLVERSKSILNRKSYDNMLMLIKKHKVDLNKTIEYKVKPNSIVFKGGAKILFSQKSLPVLLVRGKKYNVYQQPITSVWSEVAGKQSAPRKNGYFTDLIFPEANAFVFAMGAVMAGSIVLIMGGAALGGWLHKLRVKCSKKKGETGVVLKVYSMQMKGRNIPFSDVNSCAELKRNSTSVAQSVTEQMKAQGYNVRNEQRFRQNMQKKIEGMGGR